MPAADTFATAIKGRFADDIAGIVDDMAQAAVKIWDMGDAVISEELIQVATDDAQYRLDLAVDSAGWQGYQAGRVDAIAGEGGRFRWNLDPGANHCETCLEYAAGGPYTFDELVSTIGIPGDAPTICDGGCRCNLVAA